MELKKIPCKVKFHLSAYYHKTELNQAPVVQSIVSLTKLFVEDLLSLTRIAKSFAVVFFAEKLLGAFALQKLLTVFQQKKVAFLCIQYV